MNIPAVANAQSWFGMRLPGPSTDPTKHVVETDGTDIPVHPPRFGPGPMDPLLQGARIKKDVAASVAFSLKSRANGDFLWGRISGMSAFYDHQVWVLEELKKAGVRDAHLEEFTAPLIQPTSGEIRLIGDPAFGPGTQDVVLQSRMLQSQGVVNATVTAPMIYVAHSTDADLAGRDVTGKVAVLHSTPNPGTYSRSESGRAAQLVAKGAIGVIEVLEQAENATTTFGLRPIPPPGRGGCDTTPCFSVGGEDGFFLEAVLGKAAGAGKAVNVRLSTASESLPAAKTANVVGTIPGKTNRTIIINAHGDAWLTGADDNSSGVATLLALARYFAKQPQPERTMVFLVSSGHHSPGNGGRQFRAMHDTDYVANADLILNIEHVAVTGVVRSMVERQETNFGNKLLATTTEWPKAVGVNNRAPFLIDLWRQASSCFGIALQRVVDTRNPGDIGAFAELKVPQTQMISVGPIYHTSGETVDSVPDAGLERAARFHAYLLKEVDKAPATLLNGEAWTARTSCPPTP